MLQANPRFDHDFLLKCPHMGAKMQGNVTFLSINDIQQSNHVVCIIVSSMKLPLFIGSIDSILHAFFYIKSNYYQILWCILK